MTREQRYGIRSLKRDFPDDNSVLEFMFDALHSRNCSCDGTWSESIPLPYRRNILVKACWTCGAGFFVTSSYEYHYRSNHTDGLAYIRKPEGFLTSYRICRGIDKPLPESLVFHATKPKGDK